MSAYDIVRNGLWVAVMEKPDQAQEVSHSSEMKPEIKTEKSSKDQAGS